MGKSEEATGFLKFARSLGRVTGQLLEKAHAEELADKARAGVKRWLDEAEKSAEKKEASDGAEDEGEAQDEKEEASPEP